MEDGGVAVVTIDLPGTKVNVMGTLFLQELPPLLEKLENDPAVNVIVFVSGKSDFIVGADIPLLGEVAKRGKDAVRDELSKASHGFFDKMTGGKTKVAAISGSCLGGGAEFALACHYRIATLDASIGFPEVMLGLLPGAGGTQRLPKLIGIQAAMPMILTGATKKGKSAKSMGLVDMTCEPDQLRACAVVCAQQIAAGKLRIPKRGEFKGANKYIEKAIQEYSFVRDYVFKQAKQQVMKSTAGNYPAPLKILDTLKKSLDAGVLGKPKGYDIEAENFAELALTPECAGLKSVFFGQTALKKNPFTGAKPVQNIGVLGAGLMGAGIAEVSINKGFNVALKDLNKAGLQRGEMQIQGNLDKKVKKKRMTAWDKNVILSRLTGLTDDMSYWPIHFKRADLVIEAVFEDCKIPPYTH
jgi:enoyl-CoA hydratase/long-chain 3-hydroxyacyl-CoA dehydrogenase